jgi:phosphoribosylanthranilate isomerase
MTWIKICGITNLQDAKLAVEAGADALGFVFYEKSPRKVSREAAREIVAQLPDRLEKVGVFAGESLESISAAISSVNLTAVQLHGRSIASDFPELATKARILIGVPARDLESAEFQAGWRPGTEKQVTALLVDSSTADLHGGTGQTFGWEHAADSLKQLASSFKIVVAGGLNPGNVGEAIRTLHPWGVDVASGTEAMPGKKDPEKVRAFVDAVKGADRAA